jgi:Uma2 family endonuclease
MSTARRIQPLSVAGYLQGEQDAAHKHEYVEGDVFAMVGASNNHNRIATNGTVSLGQQLRGKPCQVFNSDTKIRIQLTRGTRFYYPDLSVVCRPNPSDDSFQDEPVVIVEVISESTRRNDEFEKRDAYLTINSLCVYIRVEQSSITTIVDRRTETGFVREIHTGHEAIIPLPEIGCRLPLTELYEDVEFPSASDKDDVDSKVMP